MRLIDADTLFDIKPEAMETIIFAGERSGKTYAIYESLFKKLVKNSPTVDAVPVVRCRECKHYKERRTKKYGNLICRCTRMGKYNMDYSVDPEDFCSRGERK